MKTRTIRDTRQESAVFVRRAIVGFLLILVALCVLASRFWFLQVVKHRELQSRSDENRILTRPLAPARGLIYDRNGVLLAENIAAFRLEVVPEQVQDMESLLADLKLTIGISEDDLDRFRSLVKSKRSYQSIPLRLKLSEEEIARFAVSRWRFRGVDVVPYLTRFYPRGKKLGHLVGYVGRIDAADAERLDASRYAGTTHVGKTGIERSYEELLHGEPGYELVEVNADRRPLRVLERVAPKPGRNLYLTVDVRIQEAGELAFADRPGASVAIDPRNGEVLAMISVPSFDPNLFVNGISQTDYNALLNSPDKPLLDRALRGSYVPGSTIKPFVAAAGLELGLRKPSDTVMSTGEFFIPGQQRGYRDVRAGGHGRVDLVQSLAQSVNTYYYALALELGIDRFSSYMARFGFGKPTGIDLEGEGSGVLPSKEWKQGRFGKPWYPGETVISGIGQGFWVVTPVQLASAVATISVGGVAHRPRLLHATQQGIGDAPEPVAESQAQPAIFRDPANWNAIREGMIAVVNGPTGTARTMGIGFPYVIAGKSGTAERYSRTTEAWQHISQVAIERHQVLFEAFTPAEAPRISVIVALEAGRGGGRDAAPVARKMLDAWLIGEGQVPSTAQSGVDPP
ncbi:MAG: penicillin-binding protein 2 [Dokdonella sp.]|jgi:penicillin-binding protein 2|uniref:penicillin-binding protein 2 n=1 Tax=Dokdonella sp. TaxID=2291710 RepID=UPI001B633F36|nr:penicillin-binding protein 2 [Dokdonella sp.]MCC6440175.1 penicillin-binding protein 2 [Rhodanobacteraceae bacterium]MBK8123095.1 penicillin-binding protein 2 [Dokdonella sp.]MBP6326819.1 penicillin-binding protein 2 [Dokdonella sp.]MBP6329325.1 penicillin-binding protein 2 [Dokdonella sp.]HNV07029.1 penicillin-binding protein 2 [Dokdonella sp.]